MSELESLLPYAVIAFNSIAIGLTYLSAFHPYRWKNIPDLKPTDIEDRTYTAQQRLNEKTKQLEYRTLVTDKSSGKKTYLSDARQYQR